MTTRNLAGWERSVITGKLDADFVLTEYQSVSGSGFGVKSNFVYYNNIEAMALGGVTAGDSSGLHLSIGGGVSISSDQSHSGTKSYKKDFYNNNDFPKVYVSLPIPSAQAYFACWFRYANNDFAGASDWSASGPYAIDVSVKKGPTRYKAKQAVPAGVDPETDYTRTYWATQTNVWKFGRIGNTLNDAYGPNRFSHEYTGTLASSLSSSFYAIDNGYGPTAGNNLVGYNPLLITPDSWHFYEQFATAGTVDGLDATYEVRINGIPSVRFAGASFRTPAKPELIQTILSPINGLDNQWQAGKSNTQMWMDEVYVTDSLNRLVITDNSTYSASTNWAVQEDVSWTDSLIYYKQNGGSFTSGTTQHLHVIANGVPVFTAPVEII